MKANVIIDGIEYNYHVTRDGRVFSLNYRGMKEVKELKINLTKKGYRQVILRKDGKSKGVRVSRLVALAYIPNPNNKPTVDHINRIRTDDSVENLRWATESEQMKNRKCPKNIKSSKPVRCIETGVIYPSIAEVQRQLGFAISNICRCCNGKLKSAYGYHWQYI